MEEMNELTAEERARILQHELEAVYGSSSYKIGRAVTWLPRHAKKALAYLAHNGPAISAKYLYTYAKYHKIANKEYAYWACLQKKDYPEALKKWFLEMNYTHQPLDLEHPKTFSEKTQWLKLHGHLDEQRDLVDKYKVRDWIREKVGEEYLIPLLGVWDRFDEIDFDKLPDRFVLKTNHGAGWNYIVQDKSKLDKADAKAKFDLWTKLNFTYYQGGLELQYEHIQPKIIAEQFIENDGGDLYDYKLCCFDGEPKVIIYIMNRYVDADERIICFDTDWNVLPDLIAHCSAVYCMAFTGYYVLRHAGSITDGARHEVRLAMTKGDIHRAEYFLRNGWYDRAEGALTDAALFLHDNKRAYDLTKPGHRAEFAETKRELCRVYDALAAQKGSASMKLRAAALRAGLGVFAMYVRARG